jgi:hypothetical protein
LTQIVVRYAKKIVGDNMEIDILRRPCMVEGLFGGQDRPFRVPGKIPMGSHQIKYCPQSRLIIECDGRFLRFFQILDPSLKLTENE